MMLCLDCPACGRPRQMEQPPCPDGHQAGCPDRACVECGTGLVLDPILPRDRRERLLRAA
jgi:hypothetical protein